MQERNYLGIRRLVVPKDLLVTCRHDDDDDDVDDADDDGCYYILFMMIMAMIYR